MEVRKLVIIGSVLVTLLVSLLLVRALFFGFVENYEMGYSFNKVTGVLEILMDVDTVVENGTIQEFRNNYSECMYCNQWYKDTEFSCFTLGMVICKRCDV